MNSFLISASVLAVVFIGGAIGLQLQRVLPEGYTTGGARDMIGAVTGLVTLLLALVLGLLIWTAFGVYSTQKASIQTTALYDLKFDAALVDFGPEAAEGRKILRSGIERTIAQIWGGETRRRLRDGKLSQRPIQSEGARGIPEFPSAVV